MADKGISGIGPTQLADLAVVRFCGVEWIDVGPDVNHDLWSGGNVPYPGTAMTMHDAFSSVSDAAIPCLDICDLYIQDIAILVTTATVGDVGDKAEIRFGRCHVDGSTGLDVDYFLEAKTIGPGIAAGTRLSWRNGGLTVAPPAKAFWHSDVNGVFGYRLPRNYRLTWGMNILDEVGGGLHSGVISVYVQYRIGSDIADD